MKKLTCNLISSIAAALAFFRRHSTSCRKVGDRQKLFASLLNGRSFVNFLLWRLCEETSETDSTATSTSRAYPGVDSSNYQIPRVIPITTMGASSSTGCFPPVTTIPAFPLTFKKLYHMFAQLAGNCRHSTSCQMAGNGYRLAPIGLLSGRVCQTICKETYSGTNPEKDSTAIGISRADLKIGSRASEVSRPALTKHREVSGNRCFLPVTITHARYLASHNPYLKVSAGYSFVELLLALVVGSIILGAAYSSYIMVARQYQRIAAFSEVQEAGVSTLQLLSRDLRMAGYKALDATMASPFGAITTPITITDSGNACCDSVAIIYDRDTATRQRITYYVLPRANPARNALYMDKDTWNGATWDNVTNQSLVADYIEDFQLQGTDPDTNGNPRIIDVSLIFRSKTLLFQAENYQKPVYDIGNYALAVNDQFHRDEFNATINIKNLR